MVMVMAVVMVILVIIVDAMIIMRVAEIDTMNIIAVRIGANLMRFVR